MQSALSNVLIPITLYTDGACLGNPGPGGYGVVLIHGDRRIELAGGYQLTTNNRMEMMAAIMGLRALTTPCRVTLYSDSRYVVDAMTKGWAKKWQANGWQRNPKEKAKNPDLWAEMLSLCSTHQVTFNWVKAHAGNRENECCDRLAVNAAKTQARQVDTGFVNGTH